MGGATAQGDNLFERLARLRRMQSNPLELQVACCVGDRGEQEPYRIWFGERAVEVTEILDRWLAPDHRYFKIKGDDRGLYIIRHDEASGRWELILFTSSELPDGFEGKDLHRA